MKHLLTNVEDGTCQLHWHTEDGMKRCGKPIAGREGNTLVCDECMDALRAIAATEAESSAEPEKK